MYYKTPKRWHRVHEQGLTQDDVRKCLTCQKEFTITKWQKSKVYCQDLCKPGFKPNKGKPKTGRPKREI